LYERHVFVLSCRAGATFSYWFVVTWFVATARLSNRQFPKKKEK
jgi:hypothetical protein